MREQPNYYSILPANVRYDERLKANEKLLYSEITALANMHGYCYASNGYFANLYDVSKRTISNWISNLDKFGYIKLEYEYKKNSKEIEKRKIFIASSIVVKEDPHEENFHTPIKKTSIPPRRNLLYPHEENFQDNNTSINNTSMNNHQRVDEDDEDFSTIIKKWNELGGKISKIKAINPGTRRFKEIKARIDEYGLDELIKGMEKIKESKFLQGYSPKSNFIINFDWFVNGDNFIKVLEDNYKDKAPKTTYRSKIRENEKSYSQRAREERFKRILESDMAYG